MHKDKADPQYSARLAADRNLAWCKLELCDLGMLLWNPASF